MLDLVFKGQAFFGGVAQGFPMVRASCVRIIPLRERGLVDLPGSYYGHLVGNEGRQEVFVRHWDRGEFQNWLRGKVSHRVGTGTKVGIAGRASRGWSRSLGGLPLDEGGRSRLCGCWIGGVLGASREARMMLHVLMCTMRGLRGLDPCGRWSDGIGISFLPFCPSCSDYPSIGTSGGDVIELPSFQPYFDFSPANTKSAKLEGI